MSSFTKLCIEAFKSSKVKEDETIIIGSDTVTKRTFTELAGPERVNAYKTAAEILGVNIYEIELPNPKGWTIGLDKYPYVLDAVSSADLLLHSTTGLLYSDAHNTALQAGKRSLMLLAPDSMIQRLFPNQKVKKRTLASAELLEKAEEIRIRSDAGTDLTLNKKGRIGGAQYGMADEPGRWDNICAGMVGTAPLENSANGTLVINGGDIILHEVTGRFVIEPIKCTIKDGYIRKIEGGTDAKLLKWFFAQFKDERSYGVSHIGWGLNDNANWLNAGMNTETQYGTTLIAFGSNFLGVSAPHCGLGGKNKGPAHLDIGMRNVEFYLDGELVVSKDEKIVHPKALPTDDE